MKKSKKKLQIMSLIKSTELAPTRNAITTNALVMPLPLQQNQPLNIITEVPAQILLSINSA